MKHIHCGDNHDSTPTTYHCAILAGVLCLALGLRLWGIQFGLPLRTHIDEPAYVISALKVASGDLWVEYPLLSPNIYQFILAAAYGMLFVVGKVTGVYSSVSAFGQSYLTDPTPFYLIARSLSAFWSMLTVVMLYGIARQLVGKNAALLATFLLSVMFIDVRHAHFAEPYALISLLSASSVYFALRFVRSNKIVYVDLLLSGLLAGAAIALRFSLAPVLAAPLTAALVKLRVPTLAQPTLRLGIRLAVVGIAGSLFGYALAYPGVILRPGGLVQALSLYTGLAKSGSGFQGFVFNSQSGAAFYLHMFIITLGKPMFISGLVGLVVFLLTPGDGRLVVLVFPLTYFMTIGLSQMAFVRYSVPLMPFMALFVSAGITAGAQILSRRWNRRIAVAFVGLSCVLVVYQPLQNIVAHNRLLTSGDTRAIAKQWIENNIPAGSRIALQWYSPTLATLSDPEPGSQHTYAAKIVSPFDNNPELYSLDYYRTNGFEYLVLSSYIYRLQRVDPIENEQREVFYQLLERNARLLAEFKPADSDKEVDFMFEEIYSPIVSLWQRDQLGPTIKIYGIAP